MSRADGVEFEFVEISPQMAARRALCLAAIIMRSDIEDEFGKKSAQTEDRALCRELNEWLRDEDLWVELSREEKQLLKKPCGSWSKRETIQISWRREAIAVLLWGLGLLDELPPYDEEVEELAPLTPLMRPTRKFIAKARLRDSGDIDDARDVAELWLWRARTYQIQNDPKEYSPPPDGETYEEIIAQSAKNRERAGLFKAKKKDYPAFGKPYRELTRDEYHQAYSLAIERLYGLNWLCGYAEDWDEVPTDT